VIACLLPPLIEIHVYYYDDGLRWLINNDVFTFSYAYLLECSSFKLHLYSCIINMAKIFKLKC
jgi:hypothetical protein